MMKRLLVVFGVVAFLAALPLSHMVMAAPATKVLICHVNSANDVLDLGPDGVITFGRVIQVDQSAVETHLTQHGDSLDFNTLDKEARKSFEDTYGIRLPNANCYFGGSPNE